MNEQVSQIIQFIITEGSPSQHYQYMNIFLSCLRFYKTSENIFLPSPVDILYVNIITFMVCTANNCYCQAGAEQAEGMFCHVILVITFISCRVESREQPITSQKIFNLGNEEHVEKAVFILLQDVLEEHEPSSFQNEADGKCSKFKKTVGTEEDVIQLFKIIMVLKL